MGMGPCLAVWRVVWNCMIERSEGVPASKYLPTTLSPTKAGFGRSHKLACLYEKNSASGRMSQSFRPIVNSTPFGKTEAIRLCILRKKLNWTNGPVWDWRRWQTWIGIDGTVMVALWRQCQTRFRRCANYQEGSVFPTRAASEELP